jgi:MFS transporter, putative metabolite:H+ symporter
LSVGSLLAAVSVDMNEMIVFRFLTGIGIGSEIVIVAVYVGEILPKIKRGRFTSIFLMFGVAGVVTTGPVSFFLIQQSHISIIGINNVQGWQIVMALPGVLGFVVILFRAFMPESPRWLMTKGRTKEANKLLLSLGIEPLTTELA